MAGESVGDDDTAALQYSHGSIEDSKFSFVGAADGPEVDRAGGQLWRPVTRPPRGPPTECVRTVLLG
jgi:hypothetical protein